jgi:hypothetical protein
VKIDPLFDRVLRRLEPDDDAVAKGMQRAERVARILRNDRDTGVLHTTIGGSCAKGTALNPVTDVDLFVYLDTAAWLLRDGRSPYSPGYVLGAFHQRLARTFQVHLGEGDVSIRRQDHSVRVRYAKGGSLSIDVVPALWTDQNRAEIVRIPERSSREWRETCVNRQRLLLDKHDDQNRYLRRAIRLLKYWRNGHQLDLPSYALELLAVHAVARVESRYHRAVCISVFRWIVESDLREPVFVTDYVRPSEQRLPKTDEVVIMDAAVAGNNVAAELGAGARRRIVSAAQRALDRLSAAEHHMTRGRRGDASRAFGEAFSRAKRRPVLVTTRIGRSNTKAKSGGLLDWLFK